MAKFQEGQKVKFVGNPEDHGRIDSDLKVGDTFVIQEATRGCKRDLYRYGVYWYNNNELKLVNMAKFEKGDTVRVKEDAFNYHNPASNIYLMKKLQGETGVIKKEAGIFENCFVVDCNGSTWTWHQAQLEQVTETDMANNFDQFYVEVDGPNHSQLLQEIAFQEDYEWNSGDQKIQGRDNSYLIFNSRKDGTIVCSNGGFTIIIKSIENKLEDFTINEFRQALNGEYFEDEPIHVGSHEVEFYPEHIKVGCQEYPNNVVKKAYRAQEELESLIDNYNLEFSFSHPDVGKIDSDTIEEIYNRLD